MRCTYRPQVQGNTGHYTSHYTSHKVESLPLSILAANLSNPSHFLLVATHSDPYTMSTTVQITVSARVLLRQRRREYRMPIFKMLSRSRAPSIIMHASAQVRCIYACTYGRMAYGHVTVHLSFNTVYCKYNSLSLPLL